MTDPMADFFKSRSASEAPDKVIVEGNPGPVTPVETVWLGHDAVASGEDSVALTFPPGTFVTIDEVESEDEDFPPGTFIGNNIPSDIPACATIFVQSDPEPSWFQKLKNKLMRKNK